MRRMFIASLFVLAIIIISVSFAADMEGELTVYRKADIKDRSLVLELLINDPTKAKIEENIQLLVRKYGKRKRLQIDIFDDLEALRRRGDESYPTKLIYAHWLVSITDKEIHRFYLKERPEIE